MQWTGPAAWSAREVRAGTRLPYRRQHDDGTVELRDGAVMRVIRVPGLPFETDDADALDHHQAVRELLLRSAVDARFVVYHHILRLRTAVAIEGIFESPFAEALDERRRAHLARQPLYANEQFITVLRRPARGKTGWAERLLRRLRAPEDQQADARRELDAATTALLSGLAPYGATLLGVDDAAGGVRLARPLELLSALYNGELRPVALPDAAPSAAGTARATRQADVGHHLPYARVSFGLNAIETAGAGTRSFAALLSLKDYPAATRPGILDALLRLPHEITLSESFAPAERQVARERIDLALRRLKVADADAASERLDMLAAKDALSAGATAFGDHHLTLLVRAATPGALDAAAAEVAAAMADAGVVAVREDTQLEPAFWGQFPGNEALLVRRALVSSANAAGFLSLHGFAGGRAAGNHWGPAVTVFETTSGTPYYFNFHAGDLGHFTVIGPSGSGKTVVLNFLTAQAGKFAPRVVFFDKDRGAEIFLRALGGHYARIARGQRTGFNPLALPGTAEDRAFLCRWFAVLLAADGAEELATIADAVDACFDGTPALRRLRHFRELLAGGRRPSAGDLAARLSPYVDGGEHAWLFDNARDALDFERMVMGFDMTTLLDQPRLRTPVMMYLFHRIDEHLRGEPTLILIDEGWKALDDPEFAARIRDWLKTLRKRNAIVGFATQSARDALDSSIAPALVEQTATMIFMPNAKARAEDYCGGFGLSAHEHALIRALPASSRCFLVRHAQQSVVARLDLGGMDDLLMVLSGRESAVRRLDTIRARVGDAPAAWYPLLTGASWPGQDGRPAAGVPDRFEEAA
ncbi:VirB4 family type IV secretion/conjugal transfer ATPase [Pseudorhodoferax sp.]|uniref:VirB4 family type IV secretion/conjugal transfer ATPase n=1 Tax=Pseudorhodoferax sp. TaxID=1993553 RepID=UPI0039E4F08C